MAGLENIKTIAGLAIPGNDDIRKTWFGSLMGQATVAVLLIVAYLSAIGLVYAEFGAALAELQDLHPLIFYISIGAPLLLVLIFSTIPTILRASRERKLYPLSTKSTDQSSSYYQLHPYEAADRDRFHRPDNALETALQWLETTENAVLYLSGASGAGKSSLVAAGLIPTLTDRGWRTTLVRGMGTPLTGLTTAVAEVYAEVFGTPPATNTPAQMLTDISATLQQTNQPPLLIILDQFEEYLILEGGEAKADYAAFLTEVATTPLPHIHILHVFRADYGPLIFKENLPDNIPHKSGFEIAPFDRRGAEAFLNNGPQQLDQRGYAALFAGLDRIEDTRGMYRPITLNMIGYVLARHGEVLTTDPSRLIETYLIEAITKGTSRDFATPILQAMITREGTKEARTEAQIASLTNIEPWRIKATLIDLARDGLVREMGGEVDGQTDGQSVENMWEVAHDFLARQIGQLVGRLRKPWINRNALPALAVGAVGWTAAVIIALPAWEQRLELRAFDIIQKAGFSRLPDTATGRGFKIQGRGSDEALKTFAEAAKRLNLSTLDLSFADGITDLSPLKGAPLTNLDLSDADGITDLSPLKDIIGLKIRGASNALMQTLNGGD
ncbi:MAG: leucine-rich repeat domain-containing protein [Pikeienuella sp.]